MSKQLQHSGIPLNKDTASSLFNQRKFQQPFPLQKPHKPLPSGTNMCSLSNLYDIHAQAAQPFCYV